METGALVEELRRMGLTGYEARCFVNLARIGPCDPRRVASEAGIPYPSAYEALRRLSDRGWVELVKRRPATYRAREPEVIKGEVEKRTDEAFETLGGLYRRTPAEEAELVYTLRGREKVLSKVRELLDSARGSLMLAAPRASVTDGSLLDPLLDALSRKVKIRMLSDDASNDVMPPGAELRTGNLVAVDLLVDGEKALIALPDYSACGWVDSPQVAMHFEQFLELMWNASRPARKRGQGDHPTA